MTPNVPTLNKALNQFRTDLEGARKLIDRALTSIGEAYQASGNTAGAQAHGPTLAKPRRIHRRARRGPAIAVAANKRQPVKVSTAKAA